MYLPLIAALIMPCALMVFVTSAAGRGDPDDRWTTLSPPTRRLMHVPSNPWLVRAPRRSPTALSPGTKRTRVYGALTNTTEG